MSTALHDRTVMHNADFICILYRRQAMSNGDRCPAFLGTVQRVLNYLLIFTVQCTRCYTKSYAGYHHSTILHLLRTLIEQQNLRIPKQCPSDG